MKQETSEALIRTSFMAGGAATAWSLQDWSHIVAITVGLVTIMYGLVNLVFLVRKWYKLEQSGWRKPRLTDHGDLG